MAARTVRSEDFMRQHRRITERCLANAGIATPSAARIAEQLEAALRRELGGAQAYIALDRPTPALLAQRAAELRGQGLSAADIAARLGRSKSNVYLLLQRARKAAV